MSRRFVEGNLSESSFLDIWERRFSRFREGRRGLAAASCGACRHWDLCEGGGCHLFDPGRRCDRDVQPETDRRILGVAAMPDESRRTFLLRYAAMALAALAPNGARAAEDDGRGQAARRPGLAHQGRLRPAAEPLSDPPSPSAAPPAPALRSAAEPLSDRRSAAAAAARSRLRPAAAEPARLVKSRRLGDRQLR